MSRDGSSTEKTRVHGDSRTISVCAIGGNAVGSGNGGDAIVDVSFDIAAHDETDYEDNRRYKDSTANDELNFGSLGKDFKNMGKMFETTVEIIGKLFNL